MVTAEAAGFLSPGRITISSAPEQVEAKPILKLLETVGVRASLSESQAIIEVGEVVGNFPKRLFDSIQGSLYLVPGLLQHTGRARIRPAGRCAIGNAPGGVRPTSHYMRVLNQFGAVTNDSTGNVGLSAAGFKSAKVDLRDFVEDRERLSGPEYSKAMKFSILCAAAASGMSEVFLPIP